MFGPIKKPSRLGQWDGRRRSRAATSRCCRGCGSAQRAAAPAARCCVTVLRGHLLAYSCGPPLPYRVGEICRTICGPASTSRSSTRPRRCAPRRSRGTPAARAARDPARVRGRAMPCRLSSIATRPACCSCRAASRSPNAQLRPAARGRPGLSSTAAAWPTTAPRRRPVPGPQPAGGPGRALRRPLPAGLAQSLPKIVGVCVLVAGDAGARPVCAATPPWHAVLVPLTVTAMVLTIAYNPQFALLMSLSLTLAMTVRWAPAWPPARGDGRAGDRDAAAAQRAHADPAGRGRRRRRPRLPGHDRRHRTVLGGQTGI